MCKTSVTNRNEKRKLLAERHFLKRKELKEKIADPNISFVEKIALIQKLDNMPVDSSAVRYRNRCNLTGRPRGYDRKLGICRIKMRELIQQIPGMKKASW